MNPLRCRDKTRSCLMCDVFVPPRSLPVDTSWDLAPTVLLSLVVYAAAYVHRWRRVRAQHGERGAGVKHLVLWLAGLLCIFVALCSPVDAMAIDLASAHMVQHLLLADLAPIALILGLTKLLLRPVTRTIAAIERKAGFVASPVFGVVAYVGAMWLWHVPAFYDAALQHPGVHVLEHICFMAAGTLYWWHLISPIRSRLRLGGMASIAYMASTKLLVGALGVLLTFLPTLLYRPYDVGGATHWGMSALDDQHVAGAIMGLEQSLVMGVGLAYLFFRMLAESERADERAERLDNARVAETTP